jgi:hypothetical protein
MLRALDAPTWKGVRKTSGTGMKSTSHSSSPNSVAQMPPSLQERESKSRGEAAAVMICW